MVNSSGIIWLSTDSKNNLWVGSRNGVHCYSNSNIHLKPKYSLFEKYKVSSVLEDNEGGWWFSTLTKGVFYTRNLNIKTITGFDNLKENEVKTITHDCSGNLWFGNIHNNIIMIDRQKSHKHFEVDKYNTKIKKIYYSDFYDKLWAFGDREVYLYKDDGFRKEIFPKHNKTSLSNISIPSKKYVKF